MENKLVGYADISNCPITEYSVLINGSAIGGESIVSKKPTKENFVPIYVGKKTVDGIEVPFTFFG